MKFIIAAISILVAVTALVVVINPPMHKEVQLVVTDFNFNESKTVNTTQNIAIESKNNTVSSQKVEISTADAVKNVSNISTTSTQTQQKNIDVKPVSAQKQQVQATVKPVNNAKDVNKTVVTPKTQSQTVKTTVNTVKNTQSQTTTVKQPVPAKPAQTIATKTPAVKPVQTTTAKTPVVSETQEIVWNQWKANVHNNIVAKVQLPKSKIPNGTVFQYSFTVSNDGSITNIRTTSEAPQYTAYAIQYIAPAIRNSQHASFLKFPSGTQRTSINVLYKFKVTNSAGSMASASNFNDVEIIKK